MTVDELVLVLALDPTKFNEGQKAALDAFNKTQEAALKGGKAIEEQSKKSMDALGGLKTQALELFAAYTGGVGLVELFAHLTHADAAVGKFSRATGVSAAELSKWQGVARLTGGSAEDMAGSFKQISDVFTAWQIGGPEAPGVMQILSRITQEAQRLDSAHAKIFDSTKGQSQYFRDLADNLKIIRDLGADKNLASYLSGKVGVGGDLFDILSRGSGGAQKLLDIVEKLGHATQASVDAATELERRWNAIFLRSEGAGREAGVIPQILATSDFLNLPPKETMSVIGKDLKRRYEERGLFGAWWDALTFQGAETPTYKKIYGDPSGGSLADGSQPGSPAAYRSAIAAIESRGSGGYAAQGPVTASGDRALGRYQVMSSNLAPWSKAALGREMSASEFLASPEAQDKIFDFKFGQYVKQFGNPQDAASAWFTGKPLAEGANRHDLFGTTGAAYAQRFSANMATDSSSTTTTTVAINGPITINAGPSASASEIANKLRDLGIRRQAEANQSSVGPQ